MPVESREYFLLECLTANLDGYVGYVGYDALRREMLRRSGGTDGRDAATFCHELKRRIKRKWVPEIDRLVTTNNKAGGYRLRGDLDVRPR